SSGTADLQLYMVRATKIYEKTAVVQYLSTVFYTMMLSIML
ncbi:unnamed protein product, partial [Urochloa humidicola]